MHNAKRIRRPPQLNRAVVARFALVFVGVFAALIGPWAPLGVAYSGAVSSLGNLLVENTTLESGVLLRFQSSAESTATAAAIDKPPETDVWETTLRVHSINTHKGIGMPIDLRTLAYLPTAAFFSLALATVVPWRRRLVILGLGLVILEPLTAFLIALPVISFLGGAGPIRAFELPHVLHWPVNIVYRALVAPPGMAYAVPGLIWWALLAVTESRFMAKDAAERLTPSCAAPSTRPSRGTSP